MTARRLGSLLPLVLVASALATALSTAPATTGQAVRVRPDVVYGHKDGLALTLDVLQPPQPDGGGVLFIQSGGWYSGWRDPATRVPFFRPLLDHGYTVFIVRHGSAPRFTVAEAIADVRLSVRFVRSRAGEFGVKPERLAAMGISAGGHLSLMLATTGDDGDPQSQDELLRASSRVCAAVAICAPSDIRGWVSDPPEPIRRHRALQAPLKMDAATASACSPIVHVSATSAPVLLIHGGKDALVPPSHSEQMAAALKAVNVPAELMIVAEAGHGNVEHDKTVMPAINAWLDRRFR